MKIRPFFRRRLVLVLSALAVIAVVFVLLLHAPFVRRAALRYAIPVVEEQYGIRLEAERLDYNVAALRIGLAGVRLSAPHMPDFPFFTADYLSVALGRQSLVGTPVFRDISLTNARVFVRRREDGEMNLPRAGDRPASDPPALDIGRLDVPQMSIDVRDEQTATFLWLPSIALRLGAREGFVRLGAGEAQLYTDKQLTHISQLTGNALFDGRALHVANLRLRTDEGSALLDGSLMLIARDQAVDLRATGTADATRLARWVVVNGDLPRGDVTFDAEVKGILDMLDTRLRATSRRLAWGGLTATDLRARAHVVPERAEIEELAFGFEGGRITANAVLPLDAEGNGRLTASWSGIDAAAATRALAPTAEIVPSASIAGELNASGSGSDLIQWPAALRVDASGGRNARGHIAVAGNVVATLENRVWRLEGRQVIAGVVPATVRLGGRLAREGETEDFVNGAIQIGQTDLPALARALRTTGLADVTDEAVSSGTLEGRVRLIGRTADPRVDGEMDARDVAGSQIELRSARLTFSGRPTQPLLDFTLDTPDAIIADQTLTNVRAAGRFAGRMLTVDELSARQPDGTGMVMATATYDLQSERYNATVTGADWQLMATADQPVAGTVNLRFAGEGTIADPHGTGELSVRGAVYDERALGDVDASIALDGREARIDARAPDFAATATARVQLDARYPAVMDARVEGLDLQRVLQGIETPTPLAGTTTASLHAEGPLEAWRTGSASVEIASLDAKAGELPVRLIDPARLRYEAERVHLDRLEVGAGETLISASGTLPVFDPAPDAPAVLLTVTGDVDEVARAVAATGLTQLPIAGGGGPVALLARVTGTLQQPVVAADLEVGPGSVNLQDLPPVTNLTVRAHAEQGWVELREGAASYEGAQLEATGKAPISLLTGSDVPTALGTAAGEAVAHARATNLSPAVLGPFVEPGTLDELSGAVDATLDLATPTLELKDLTGELRIDRFDVRVADMPITQRVPTRIVARDGFARVEAWEWVGQGTTLGVRGQVRLEDRQAAILADGVVDLRVLTPFVRDAGMTTAGRLQPRLSITGALDDPRIDGDLSVTDGEIRLVDPRVLVSDLSVRTVVTRSTATITALTGSVNGGALTGGGSLSYAPEQGLQTNLTADVRGMAMEFPQGLRSELDGDLALDLNVLPDDTYAGRLSGTATVLRGAYREPMAVVTALLAGMRTQRLAAATAEPSALLEALSLDIRVITDEDIFVDNNYGRFQIGGDLRVIGTAAAPSLSGRAELREDGRLFIGRNIYTINSGAVNFSNPVAVEPELDINLRTRAGGHDIHVTITGTPENLMTEQRSLTDPDLGQADVVSLLLTGRPLDQLAPDDAAFVGTQVLGNFSGEVLGFASRAVGLDTLRLGGVDNPALRRDTSEAATELDPTTRVTFGKSLGSDVDVTFSQSLRDGDAQTWIVDYLPLRGFDLRLVSDDDDLRSYGFRHDVSFGTGGRARTEVAARPRTEAMRVSTIAISGDPVLPEARLRETLQLESGDAFDFAAWQDDRDRLENLYRAEGYLTARITARRADEPAGVALTYDIAAGPQTSIVVSGIDLDNELRARLETAWQQSVFDEFLVDEATQIIRGDLASQGYLQPMVAATVRDEGTTKTLDVTVTPGVRSTQTVIRISGADEALSDGIIVHLADRGLVDRAVADPAAVEREVSTYLRMRGYVRARVTVGAPLFEEAVAVLPLAVDAGPVFTIVRVAFEGAATIGETALREAAQFEEGTTYDPALLEAARDRLVALHRREGFAEATVMARPTIRPESSEVEVAFIVDEGPRQVLQEIVVIGNRAIDPDVISRSLDLSVGLPLRADAVLQARTRVFNTGLFRRIDVTSEAMGLDQVRRPGSASAKDAADPASTTPMRLRVTVEEWPAVRLRYGVVVAEERPETEVKGRDLVPGLSADVTRRTLFGRAVTVGIATALQRREQRGRAFLNAPTFMGLPVESSVIGERSREEFEAATFATSRTRATWEQRARLHSNLSLSYAYTFERNHTFQTKTTDPTAPLFDITINIARLNTAAAWDTRDDPTDTVRGLFASSTFELAPENLGSDIRFVRQLQQAYYFRPWRSLVFASAARVGSAFPLEGQELIPSERFFAGGSRTVRGVPEDSLGPQTLDYSYDPPRLSPTGGRLMIVLNQEVRLPIYRWIRGVGFVDAGNVFTRARDASLRDLVGSIGFGLRMTTPFALLRADYARAAWGTERKTGRWTFGIGQAF